LNKAAKNHSGLMTLLIISHELVDWFGTKRQFVATQRCVGCQSKTRRSAGTA
jgi:hypothetical protein